MIARIHRFSRRRPWIAFVAFLALGLGAYLGFRGVEFLKFRQDRKQVDQALAEFELTEARLLLDRCFVRRPDDQELRLLAVRTARRDGDIQAANTHFYKLKPSYRNNSPDAALERTLIEAQSGRVSEVIKQLIDFLEIRHPQSELILESLAMAFVQTYQFERSSFWIGELLEKNPSNPIGRLILAQTTETRGNRDSAIGMLRSLISDQPRFFKARRVLADFLFTSQRYQEAIVEYAYMHDQHPDELWQLLGLASSYSRLGAVAEAGPLMRNLEEKHSNNSEVLLECARFAMKEDRLEDAEKLLQKAVKLSPFDYVIQRELGVCLSQLGRQDEAKLHLDLFKKAESDLILLEKTFEQILRTPNDPQPRREAGQICLRNGQTAEALRWLTGALELAPKDKVTHQLLAEYYFSQGDKDRALYHQLESNAGN